MPQLFLFSLCPSEAGFGDPAWTHSRFRGECLVAAADEPEARRFAEAECGHPARRDDGPGTGPSPWLQPRLVEARRVSASAPVVAGLRGRVMRGASGCGTWTRTGRGAAGNSASA